MPDQSASRRLDGLKADELRARLAIAAPSDDQLATLLVDLGVVVARQAERAQRVADRLSTLRWLGDVFVELGYCDHLTLAQTLQRAGLPLPLGEFLRLRGRLTGGEVQRAYRSLGAKVTDASALWAWLESQGLVQPEARLAIEAERHYLDVLQHDAVAEVLGDHVPAGGESRWVPLRGQQGPVVAIQELTQLDQIAELTHRLGEEPRFVIASGAWISHTTARVPRVAGECTPDVRSNEIQRLLQAAEASHATELLLESSACATRVWLRVEGVVRRRPDLVEGFAEALLAWLEDPASADFRRQRGVRVWSAEGLFGPCVRVACACGDRVRSLADLGVPGAVRDVLQRRVLRPSAGLCLFVAPKLRDAVHVLQSVLHDARGHHERLFNALPGTDAVPGVVRFPATAAAAALDLEPEAIALSLEDPETLTRALDAVARGVKVYAAYGGSGCLEALTRLRKQGVSALDLATHLVAVVNVRTVRELCAECRELDTDVAQGTSPEVRQLQLASQVFLDHAIYRAGGCEVCADTGYAGRRPLLEPILASDALRVRLLEDPQPRVLWGALQQELKLPTLIEAGLDLAALGVTSLAELARVLPHEAPWNQAHGRNQLSVSGGELAAQQTTDEDTCWTRQYRTSSVDEEGEEGGETPGPEAPDEDAEPAAPDRGSSDALPTLAPRGAAAPGGETRMDLDSDVDLRSEIVEPART
ncbi:MAG: hypothetical protein R3F62_12250 [Planctomycetota bacterium]